MTESKIEWTGRSDWNPIRGCTRVSPGCGGPGQHGGCYAEAIAGRFSDEGQAFHGFAMRTKAGGRWTGRVEIIEDRLTLPLRWKKPATVFASSTSDIFHESLADADIDRIIAVIALTPQHTYQVLTKRADRMRAYMAGFDDRPDEFGRALARVVRAAGMDRDVGSRAIDNFVWPLPNLWLGVSVENQEWADRRREDLRATPAVIRFVSYEPALGPVDWAGWEFADQIIGGGESGPRARPMHPDWQRATRDFCAEQGVGYFFKQWGEWIPWEPDQLPYFKSQAGDLIDRHALPDFSDADLKGWTDALMYEGDDIAVHQRVGKKAAGRLLDGVEHNGVPV